MNTEVYRQQLAQTGGCDRKVGEHRSSNPMVRAYCFGLAAVLMFSGGLVSTRFAVQELPPLLVGAGRAAIAGVLSLMLLAALRQPLPARQHWPGLFVVAAGAVFAYPIFSALALEHSSAGHATVLSAVMPLMTAIFGALLSRQYPRFGFWLCAVASAVVVLCYQFLQKNGHQLGSADGWMFAACFCCAIAYAKGAMLAKSVGSWQVICWALVFSLPVMSVISFTELQTIDVASISIKAWAGVLYLSLFSMFFGFFAWYHALSLGGVSQISQLQQLSPFLSLGIAAILLGEQVSLLQWLVAALVVAFILLGRKLG